MWTAAKRQIRPCHTLIWCAAREWVIAALVQALDFIGIEAFITNLHPRAERAHGGNFSTIKRIASAAVANRR
jgi:hypothetical protein